jgi:hypothetical protein
MIAIMFIIISDLEFAVRSCGMCKVQPPVREAQCVLGFPGFNYVPCARRSARMTVLNIADFVGKFVLKENLSWIMFIFKLDIFKNIGRFGLL